MTDRARFQPGLWPRRGLMALVRGYRLLLSPWLGASCPVSYTHLRAHET